MASSELLMAVGENCLGYNAMYEYFQSSIGAPSAKSCVSCSHFKNGKCDANLFDKVATELEQS